MKTYFAWAQEGDLFSKKHLVEDLPILSLSIRQSEGGVAIARVLVGDWSTHQVKGTHAYLSYGEKSLFFGRLLSLPERITDDQTVLEFSAEPSSAHSQLQNLLKNHKNSSFWDPLFVDGISLNDPIEMLENQSCLFAWDRVTGRVHLSSIHQGRVIKDVSSVFLKDSLQVTSLKTPLSAVHVDVVAEWVQVGRGEADISSRIAASFSSGIISTLTAQSLKVGWPKIGMKLGQSGYTIIDTALKTIAPPKTGGLGLYPSVTPPFVVATGNKTRRLKHHWMKGKLVIGYHYRQKRQEVVQFTVKSGLEGAEKRLCLVLQDCRQVGFNPALSSFFQTDRGHQAVAHAIDVAATHLRGRSRCLKVSVEIPWEEGIDLSTDHSVYIKDVRLPGGEITGKIMAYELYQDEQTAITRITLGVTQSGIGQEEIKLAVNQYVEQDYGDVNEATHYKTPGGMTFYDYSSYHPPGITNAEMLGAYDLVQSVTVQGDGFRQTDLLLQNQYPLCLDFKTALSQLPTEIEIILKSLKTKGVLKHTIPVDIGGLK